MRKEHSNIETGLFVLILLVVVFFRCQVLIKFGFKYTDSDQTIMWNGLVNYAEGKFHEPRFYGQNYNTMLESLFGVPLYKIGLPIYVTLPITTSVLTLFPYIFISFLTFKKKSAFAGLIILSIPLLLPIEYSLITSLSRGFVSGIFVASLGAISMFYPNRRWSFFLLGFVSVLGFSINPNSVLISFPCLIYLFLINRRNKQFYLYSASGLILAGFIHFWANSFYIIHPNYNLHKSPLGFSFRRMVDSFENLDLFFNDVSPIFWKQGFIYLPIFILFSFLFFWKRKMNIGLFILSIPLLIILTTGINKVHDGFDSVFFPLSRMYLALPILIGISLSFIKISKTNYVYFVIPIMLFFNKENQLNQTINKSILNSNHLVRVDKVNHVLSECQELSEICEENNIDLVVISKHYNYDILNYGCPACTDNFPKTLRPDYERRTWRLIEDEKSTYKNILLIDNSNTLDKQFDFIQKLKNTSDKYLIKDNKLRTMELLNKIGLTVRKY